MYKQGLLVKDVKYSDHMHSFNIFLTVKSTCHYSILALKINVVLNCHIHLSWFNSHVVTW